jgi:hypothetical protein
MMDKVNQLNVYKYSFTYDTTHALQIGVIAQEVAALFPELVTENDGQYMVAYSKLSVVLLKALQEQQKEIDALELELTALASTSQTP